MWRVSAGSRHWQHVRNRVIVEQVHGGGGAVVRRRGAGSAREAARNWSGARAGQSLAAAGSDAPPARLATQCTRCLAAASLRDRRPRPTTTLLLAPDTPDALAIIHYRTISRQTLLQFIQNFLNFDNNFNT
ncbi:unnamed protein product [Chrysodeixis includens]|uniref:Uncharacterized protein n=1 Tax=Chrysodeixis includens TaxID=689277 RepID=A0A9N8PZ03_CHRIL|nr:unnamed protein product [Chrysodeixis includens]